MENNTAQFVIVWHDNRRTLRVGSSVGSQEYTTTPRSMVGHKEFRCHLLARIAPYMTCRICTTVLPERLPQICPGAAQDHGQAEGKSTFLGLSGLSSSS